MYTMATSEPHIAVVGAGANGASIGADLVRAGRDVTFVEQWPAHVEAMRRDGVRIEQPSGSQVTPVRVLHVCEVATLQDTFDIVFIVIKAYDTLWSYELMRSFADDGKPGTSRWVAADRNARARRRAARRLRHHL